jgi:hypothetical protein
MIYIYIYMICTVPGPVLYHCTTAPGYYIEESRDLYDYNYDLDLKKNVRRVITKKRAAPVCQQPRVLLLLLLPVRVLGVGTISRVESVPSELQELKQSPYKMYERNTHTKCMRDPRPMYFVWGPSDLHTKCM